MRTMKHWAMAAMAAAALALAGCGGGGSSPPQATGPTPAEREYMAVSEAVTAAETAVDGLTATSMDADVTAAETAVDAARTALNGAGLLSPNQAVALNARLLAIEGDFDMVQEDIAEHRGTMDGQRMAANNAINEAMTAVNGLSDSSTDAEVQDAKDKIQAAKDAVAAATTLSMADRAALNARITPIETNLASTEMGINEYRLAMAADDAVDAAHTAVGNLTNASSDDDVQAAKDAIQAAKDAIDAANAAMALNATKATELSRRIAMIESTLGTTEMAIAAYRKQEADDAETRRVADVADARSRAMQSYMDADADATKAETAATEAETTAPGSQGAMDARAAATAARNAANAAKMAHDAIMDSMTKAEADAEAEKAATQARTANSSYMTAKAENDDIQTNAATIAENKRQQDVADARKYGGMAVDNAKTAADDARAAANAAKMAADDAMDEYERAMSARTNSTEAKKKADAAQAAYMAADMAANDANTAYMAAKAAIEGVMDNSSSDDANMARSTAETQEGVAAGHKSTAMMSQTDAEDASEDATMYANSHVVGLLRMANAVHITTAADPDANSDETEAELIAKNKADHIANVNTAVKVAADDTADPSHGGGEVTATWPHSATVTNADATEDTERTGKPVISVDPGGDGGDAVALRHAGSGTDGILGNADDETTEGEVIPNFAQGPGLGDFVHEKYISGLNATTTDNLNDFNNQRVILFTDLEQASEPKDGSSDSLDNQSVPSHTRVTITANPTGSGAQGPGNTTPRTFAGTFDHDGNSDTPAFTGNFVCVVPSCSLSLAGTNNAGEYQAGTTVSSISGYNFTGARTVAPMAPMEDATWLAFGVWLTETVVDEGVNTYAFGAFADGGDATESTEGQVVTGSATYQGKAAGVHSRTSGVNFFHGDATLNAVFGARDANGMITGEIHNIMSGGDPVLHSIYLYLSDQDAAAATPSNITDAGGFNGRTRMGTGTLGNDGEYDYPMNGTWVGSFYNPVADDTTTTTVMEDETAPGSVAGTFSVSRGDDTDTMDVNETESYVGAFGAHCSGSNCGDH